jgi:hypothetical protein
MGVKAVFGTMFPRKELIGYLTPSGMYRAKLSQRLIDNRKFEKIHRIGFWSSDHNYVRSQQAGGVTKSRKINNRKYLHPVNGIGINSWSHPWSRDREYSGFEVAEVIVFDTILTQEQLRTVEQYMQKSMVSFERVFFTITRNQDNTLHEDISDIFDDESFLSMWVKINRMTGVTYKKPSQETRGYPSL